MNNELKQLSSIAKAILQHSDTGKEYTISYVQERLEKALDEYSHDPVIRSVAQVISKQAKNGKLVTSQKELYDVYNHFAGLSANSMIKEAIGDLLYLHNNAPQATISNETAYSYRPTSPELDFKIEHNPLETLFDKQATETSYYDPTFAKLGKNAIIAELNDIGVPATEIKPVAGIGDNAAIIYDAIFTNKLGTAHIPMFVDLTDGVQTPTHFYSNSKFIELTAENLNKSIVDKAQLNEVNDVRIGGIRTASSVISPSFAFEEDAPPAITLDKVPVPAVLRDLANYEEVLLDTTTAFSPELVRTAKAICARELSGMGFEAQISLADSTDDCIICAATLDSTTGKVEIKLPVEIIDNRAQIPALFYNEANKEKMYDFSKAEVANYLTAGKLDNSHIMRYSNDFYNMNYAQLKDEILAGVAHKDYIRAEQALNRIEDKFGQELHRTALFDYAKYLAHTSVVEDKPQHKCRLLISKGSIEPRCGHYNVAISRVSTNEKGDCELLDRKAKYENLADSSNIGTMIRTNKITMT